MVAPTTDVRAMVNRAHNRTRAQCSYVQDQAAINLLLNALNNVSTAGWSVRLLVFPMASLCLLHKQSIVRWLVGASSRLPDGLLYAS